MGWLAAGSLIQLLANLAVGLRLLALARRTRRLPETAFGLALVLLGGIGYPLSIAARAGLASSPEAAGQMLAVGLLIQNVGCGALYVFLWRVFRPHDVWALALVALAGGVLAWSVPAEFLTDRFWGAIDGGPFYWSGLAARAGTFAWATVEAGLYYTRMRRRLRLGLADPVVTDRFRLWTLTSASALLAFGVFATARLLGIDPPSSPLVMATTSAAGLLAGILLWLAFLPPRAYLERVARRGRHAPSA